MKKIYFFSHGGSDYTSDNPSEAIQAALSAAQGCSAKGKAWGWADQALEICRVYFPDKVEALSEELGQGSYPQKVDFTSL